MPRSYHSMRRAGAVFPDSIAIETDFVVPDGDTAFTVCLPAGSVMCTRGVSPNFLPSI